jgi:SulP family sulfate permease
MIPAAVSQHHRFARVPASPAADSGSATAAHRGRWLDFVPAFAVLRGYSWSTFRADLVAGLTVAAVAVPQAMAYALIIGLPPEYGLYTAIVMTTVGALFDSSRQLINGPTNAISIAVLSVLVALPQADRVHPAIMLALMVGVVQLGIALMRLGKLSRHVSPAVIAGFTVGASVLLVLDQTKNLLGLHAPSGASSYFLSRFWQTLTGGGGIVPLTCAVGGGTIALILVLRLLNRRLGRQVLPEFLVVVAAMAAIVAVLNLDQHGLAVVNDIPRHLPSFAIPDLGIDEVRSLGTSAVAIALLGLLEALAMAQAIAAQTGQKIDVNQQCLSEGLANTAGGFFQCFPGSGSLTRSAINQQAGGRTQWSGVISAAAVALTVLLFAPLVRYVPLAALAGILMVTAVRMVDRPTLARLWSSRVDRSIVLGTALAAVFISVEFCILIGVSLSLGLNICKRRLAAWRHTALSAAPAKKGVGTRLCETPEGPGLAGRLVRQTGPDPFFGTLEV